MKTKIPPPAPVTIMRPADDGSLKVAEVIEAPESHRRMDDFESDVVRCNFRLIAVQETGEEMHAGYASSFYQATGKKARWLVDHPEHRDVIIERIGRAQQ